MKHSIADEGYLPLRRWLAEATEGVPDATPATRPRTLRSGCAPT
jgi:hypothetical protein